MATLLTREARIHVAISAAASRLEARSEGRSGRLPRIQDGLLDVIKPDGQPLGGHPHPRKPMRGTSKAELGVPSPDGGQPCPPAPSMIS
jgi:hypothetical protein